MFFFFLFHFSLHILSNTYAWFLTRLLLHKNAATWIIRHWIVLFDRQSVSSLCPWEGCSVLLPAVYLWAARGPVFLIIHETSTVRKRSQHNAAFLPQPTAGKTYPPVFCLCKRKMEIKFKHRKDLKRKSTRSSHVNLIVFVLFC